MDFSKKINHGEAFLELCLRYLPNDDLLTFLESEQLPKLKNLFEIPSQLTMRKKSVTSTYSQQQQYQQAHHNFPSNSSVEITPKSNSKQISLK
jgi:hypothetical protein